jgi:hypothetical protein
MKVRMLTTVAGTREKSGEPYCYEAGEEYDLPSAEARDLCSRPEDFPRAEPVAQKQSKRAERR